MSTGWKRIGGAVLIAAAVGIASAADAAQRKVVWSKTARQTVVETKMVAGGIPERELVQSVYIDTCRSADHEFDGMVEQIYGQDDNSPGGNGVHRGYAVNRLKSGDQLFQRYEGSHKVVVKEDGVWEATYRGRSEVIGGTGKYKNARGWITYTGRITPEGITEEDIAEIEY
jgi:hypothetical protein